jgi:hypothetical protein
MNILPLVCGLIFIFSCLAFTFFRDAKSLSIAEWSLTAAARTERAVNNRLEVRKFRKASTAAKKENKTPPKPKEEKTRGSAVYLRAISPFPDTSKLSLTPLFEPMADPSRHIAYQTAARLLVLLYEKTSLFSTPPKKGWETQILNALIAQEKTLNAYHDLAEFFPKDPKLAHLYYHMLKGTNHYSIEKTQGIPPLRDFFTLGEEAEKDAFNFYFAPPVLLTALFGAKVAQEVLALEKKNWKEEKTYHLLDKQELQELLFKHNGADGNLSAFEPYLSFSKQIPPKEKLSGTDKQTGMRITRKCQPVR